MHLEGATNASDSDFIEITELQNTRITSPVSSLHM